MALSGNQLTRIAVGGPGIAYAGFTAKSETDPNPWTNQSDSTDTWSAQADSSDTWTAQADSTDTWT